MKSIVNIEFKTKDLKITSHIEDKMMIEEEIDEKEVEKDLKIETTNITKNLHKKKNQYKLQIQQLKRQKIMKRNKD